MQMAIKVHVLAYIQELVVRARQLDFVAQLVRALHRVTFLPIQGVKKNAMEIQQAVVRHKLY
jgi:hypothetical protein